MKIKIELHTLKRASERGASEAEIIEVIESGNEIDSKNNRLAKEKVFGFNSTWNKKKYEQKKVEVIYVIENDVIVTVTVYVFYGKWGRK
jgi:hypothetical protein